ncbi:Acetylornithine deacetylase [Candidatus Rhodobacter oscarellae]|uniref:Acetylornithine deacetylase n=1 Tax=Candidatus Rhodobacter oscarellae TaxID=1675527 RepID=A0A0J9E3F7_9RHOB|nr:acetylornithine deacetylase [Candidatus Rhodobacter lobularis]KMW56359.1 Acetylornithine deacetylase [Candidatus Rhodobacter lobularis]
MNARSILEKLVSFPTVSTESNLELIGWVEEYLKSLGVASTIVPSADGKKAQLYAHVGPEVEGGVVLSGHTDVVPVAGQAWDTDPFTVVERDGKLFGRGTCDMKGFDALALAAVPLALERGIKRPLQIALSRDEEIGCIGAPEMIDHMVASGMPRASMAVIGEPSMMKAVTGHKGGCGYHTHIHGFEVHSSLMHTGVSAVHEAAKLITWADEMNAANAAKAPSAVDAMFEPPWSSAHVGVISGGTANNITAKDCTFVMGFRVLPSESHAEWLQAYEARVREVEAEMQAVVPETRIELREVFNVKGLRPEEDGQAEALVRRLTGDNGSHVVSYGTEAGQFQERGYSAVVCGPGNIAQAHQPNEFVSVAQFEAGWKFMEDLVEDLAT